MCASDMDINTQLAAAVDWWLQSLERQPRREGPHALASRHTVVTYPDSEGSEGHVGVALRSSRGGPPFRGSFSSATNIEQYVPDDVSENVDNGSDMDMYHYMFLKLKPQSHCLTCIMFRVSSRMPCAWLVTSGDHIVGFTWNNPWPWMACQEVYSNERRRAGEHGAQSPDVGVQLMQKVTAIHPTTNTLMCTVCVIRRMENKLQITCAAHPDSWNEVFDKRLARFICYMNHTKHYRRCIPMLRRPLHAPSNREGSSVQTH